MVCESLLIHVLLYGNETMIWREKERSKIWDVQIENLKGLLGIRRMDRCPMHGVTKGVGEEGSR